MKFLTSKGAYSLLGASSWKVSWQIPKSDYFPRRLRPLCNPISQRPAGDLRLALLVPGAPLMDVVEVGLEDDLLEGEDEDEEHPDLHQLDAARLRQVVRYAQEPEAGTKIENN